MRTQRTSSNSWAFVLGHQNGVVCFCVGRLTSVRLKTIRWTTKPLTSNSWRQCRTCVAKASKVFPEQKSVRLHHRIGHHNIQLGLLNLDFIRSTTCPAFRRKPLTWYICLNYSVIDIKKVNIFAEDFLARILTRWRPPRVHCDSGDSQHSNVTYASQMFVVLATAFCDSLWFIQLNIAPDSFGENPDVLEVKQRG